MVGIFVVLSQHDFISVDMYVDIIQVSKLVETLKMTNIFQKK